MARSLTPFLDRFWEKVQEDESGCWLWTGSTVGHPPHVYGSMFSRSYKPRVKAHVLSWEMANALPVPEGLSVCHSCDVTLCVYPGHLFVGTHSDNMRDMHAKNRWSRGKSILKPEKVEEIRTMYATGKYTHKSLSAELGIAKGTVFNALSDGNWPSE